MTDFNPQGGYGLLDTIKKEVEAARAGQGFKPWRFFLKKGETRSIIVLEDNPPIIKEHNLKINGKWGHIYTCLQNTGQPCPLCAANDKPYRIGFYTIVDRTPFEYDRKVRDDNGKETGQTERVKGKDRIKALGAKYEMLLKLQGRSQKYGGLVGVTFDVTRSDSDKSPSIGDDWEKTGRLDTDDIVKLLQAQNRGEKPITSIQQVLIKWGEFLKPETPEKLKEVVAGKVDAPDEEDGGGLSGADVDWT